MINTTADLSVFIDNNAASGWSNWVAAAAVVLYLIKEYFVLKSLRAHHRHFFFLKLNTKSNQTQVSFDWKSFNTSWYWAVLADNLKVSITDTQPYENSRQPAKENSVWKTQPLLI